jgi:hypothetical protein
MMKKILMPGILLLTLFACSYREPVPADAGAARLEPRRVEHIESMEAWAFNPKVRILSDALTARIRPVERAAITSEALDGGEPCREVQTNSAAEDGDKPGMQNEVSVAVSGSRVVVTYNDDNHLRESVSGFAWSQDGGMTFTDGGGFFPAQDYFGGGDPLILADPNDPERWLYIQLTYGSDYSSILAHESLDGGKTFPPEQSRDILVGLKSPVKGRPMTSPAFFHDKEWAAWDGPSDTLALSWGLGTYTAAYPVVITSNDGGRTWSDGVNLASGNEMGGLSAVATGPGGELYVAWLEYYSSTLRLSRSLDGGRTWEGPFLAADTFQAPYDSQATNACGRTALAGKIRITTVPSLAADPDTGALYLVYNYKQDKHSDDDSDIGFVRSLDRGETWLRNRRLTCRSFPVAQESCYMGDYNQVVTDGSFYYAAWGDNRNTVEVNGREEPNPDVYMIRVGVRPRTRPVTPP